MLYRLIREDSYQGRTCQLGEERSTPKEEKLQSLEGDSKLSLQEKIKVSRAVGVGWTGEREAAKAVKYGLTEDRDDFDPEHSR